jgi:hypothetical protein
MDDIMTGNKSRKNKAANLSQRFLFVDLPAYHLAGLKNVKMLDI